MPRPTSATIDLSALRSNFALVRRLAPRSRVFAVMKANAYGHGLMRCAASLAATDGYATLEIDAAVRLRDAGHEQPVLLLEGVFDARELETAAARGFAIALHDPAQIDMLRALAGDAAVDVFIKLNTGMNRLGIAPDRLGAVLAELKGKRQVRTLTLMTHFACADDDRGIAAQFAVFQRVGAGLNLPTSLANSATILRYPEAHGDWVRPGIMLYGGSPFADISAESLGLQPVMTLTSQLIGVQNLAPGDAVGYGATFVAPVAMRIGVVACGYADGYPRHAASGTPILVAGQRTTTVGRVSMDMLCADITHIPQAAVGSPVTLWGRGLAADEVATAAGTVSYELFCALAARVPMTESP